MIVTISCGKLAKFDKNDPLLKSLLLGMRIKEKAWFNVCNENVYKRINAN
jgi:hypothetical protein